MPHLLGIDVGSSSIKTTLVDAKTGRVSISMTSPSDTELEINSPRPGFAEQDPNVWWQHIKLAIAQIKKVAPRKLSNTRAIGITYQMHGLVIINSQGNVLRPAIIWCDSRAIEIGNNAFNSIGKGICLEKLLNSPANFTASKLAWVKENEPDIYKNVYAAMLPGDYIAFRLTGEVSTTPSGLSEGTLWNMKDGGLATFLLEHFGIDPRIFPKVNPTFSVQGEVHENVANELGLPVGIPVSYRAGDQPNNAFSLGVLKPGSIATNAGTSGVVYAVGDQANYDPLSRVNTFLHVNHSPSYPRYGTLLCINGTGILNNWARQTLLDNKLKYDEMNQLATTAPVGADGLVVLPYGNGAERSLQNANLGASISSIDLNRHSTAHVLRAIQEGIVFSLCYGTSVLNKLGIELKEVHAGSANMFLSPLFREAFATTTGAVLRLYDTDGSQGAARGAGVGAGVYAEFEDAFVGLNALETIEPNFELESEYLAAYKRWKDVLEAKLNQR